MLAKTCAYVHLKLQWASIVDHLFTDMLKRYPLMFQQPYSHNSAGYSSKDCHLDFI